MTARYLVVLSDADPVARGLAERWGTPPATGGHVGDPPVRTLRPSVHVVRRPSAHVHDDALAAELPAEYRSGATTVLFPSIHRSAAGPLCLAVHPLGNWGDAAELGGRARSLVPTDPRSMAAVLRAFSEVGSRFGLAATYEATHHGPWLPVPAFFAEIGGGPSPDVPASEHLDALAAALDRIEEDPRDRIALGVGGGHYVPHFTDLALRRSWAFGHLAPRHVLEAVDAATARAAWEATPGAEGVLYARAADAERPAWKALGPRLREGLAPPRAGGLR